jgi:hypothetical protein
MDRNVNVWTPDEDGAWSLDDMPCKPKLEIIPSKCSEDRTRVYKGCRLTNVIEPAYTPLERFVRWIGCKLNIEFLYSFHEKETWATFSFESVEYLDDDQD